MLLLRLNWFQNTNIFLAALGSCCKSHQTTSVAKIVSEAWKNMDAAERAKWDKLASDDKHRFEDEKGKYRGPWTVPIGHRRSKVGCYFSLRGQ